METIELKPHRLRLAMRLFLVTFVWCLVMTLWRYGLCDQSEIWLVLRARAIEALAVTAIVLLFPLRYRNIKLTETTLQAPIKKRGRWGGWKSTTVDLSDVVLSRAVVDRICGSQLITSDDHAIDINPFYYRIGTIPKLLNEIEHRQELIMNCRKRSEAVSPGAITEIRPC